jgi:hypothetical protein
VRVALIALILSMTFAIAGFVYEGFTFPRAKRRPMLFYTAWILLAADVVFINRVFRRGGLGPVERIFRWLATRRWKIVNQPAQSLTIIGFLALAGLAIEAVGDFHESGGLSRIVKDPALAERLQNSDRLFYATDKKGELIWFHLNPQVVRELRSHGISVGTKEAATLAVPVPGVLPLIVLAAMASFAALGKWAEIRADRSDFFPPSKAPLTALQFGLIQLFAVGWYVSAQFGVFDEHGGAEFEWAFTAVLLLLGSAGLLIPICHKLYDTELDPSSHVFWHLYFFAAQALGFAGAAFVGPPIRPTPMWAWAWCYLFLTVLLGVLSIPSRPFLKAATKER